MRSHLKVQGKIVFFLPQYHYFLFSLRVVFVRNKTVLDTAFEMFVKDDFFGSNRTRNLLRHERQKTIFIKCSVDWNERRAPWLSSSLLSVANLELIGLEISTTNRPRWVRALWCNFVKYIAKTKSIKQTVSFSPGQKSWTKSIMAVVQQMSLQFSCLF